jgi:nitrous oxidase accessory protein NosD
MTSGPAKLRRLVGISAVATVVAAVGASAAVAKTLYVSPTGHDRGACTSKQPCKKISFAIAKARRGDTVKVAKGAYREDVTVARGIKLIGVGTPVIKAVGANGILITGAKARGAVVDGFAVQHALNEGILALQTSDVTIEHNVVRLNDQGVKAANPTGECKAAGQVPGDCGEGLHLMTVTHSTVTGNTVEDNLGGILLTDEFGPTAHNEISLNTVLRNVADCGITIAGHNPHAASVPSGTPNPSAGGIYDNKILANVANGNGVKGEGAGILLAGGAPGTAVYSNLVQANIANGNGLGGLTLHSHAPGQDLNGNRIINNSFSHDAVAGNGGPGKPGDSDAGLKQTAGIVLFSAFTKLKGTVVQGNRLSNEYYGIWTQNVPTIKKSQNKFAKSVTVPIFQQ